MRCRRFATFVVALVFGLTTLMVAAPADAAPSQPALVPAQTEIAPGVSDSVVRLYLAVFDRTPDPDGLAYWVGTYHRGTPLQKVATEFMASEEWRLTYGSLDDAGFVGLVYANVLDRAPDDAGFAYWTGILAAGTDRAQLLLGFSESPEFVTLTGTAAPTPPPPPPFPSAPAGSGEGRRIIYSNSGQRVWWIEADGTVVNSYLVSGRRGDPSPGTYKVYSKSPVAWAGHDGITMRHMVRFAQGRNLAIGFHSIPRYGNGTPMQTLDQLGTFRSSGCVRQRDDLAAALYSWADIGTTVVVLP